MTDIRTGGEMTMTRREFGLGIAAILAAGVAPSVMAFGRRGIAARGAAFGGGGGWQNPYVTDGMVAMWDGAWNAGGGLPHDASATVWADLSGYGHDLQFVADLGGASWDGGNHIYLPNGDKTELVVARLSSPLPIGETDLGSVETVCDMGYWVYTDLYQNLQTPFSVAGYACPSGRGPQSGRPGNSCLYLRNGRLCAFNDSGGNIDGPHYRAAFSDASKNSITLSLDGVTKVVSQNYFEGSSYVVGDAWVSRPPRCNAKLYSVRVYNRQLTAAEIAANYAVDKARFGIA